MSLLGQICCCLRTKDENYDEPDEQTRLMRPAGDSEPTPSSRTILDHQHMKERLGTIVRSKEGKMVSVNAPLPFNMHNKAIPRLSSFASNSEPRSHARISSRHPSIDTDFTSSESISEEGMGFGGGSAQGGNDIVEGAPQRGPHLSLRLVNASGSRRSSGSRGRGRRRSGGVDIGKESADAVHDDGKKGSETSGEIISPPLDTDKGEVPPRPRSPLVLKIGSISRSWGDT